MKRILAVLVTLLIAAMSNAAGPVAYKLKVVKEYPHDIFSYTQGLFFHDGRLYESAGQYGESSLRIVDLPSGKPVKKVDFAKKYFLEGSVVFEGKMYVLTWTNKVIFVYDPETLKYEKAFSYPRDGWGLTTDGKFLIASDGSSKLYFMDGGLRTLRTVEVTLNGRPVRLLNELEYIDGKVWANVYTSDVIVIINPESGAVEGVVDCSGLLPDKLRTRRTDVLNGIAQDPKTGKIYLTGKYWPRLYEISIVRK